MSIFSLPGIPRADFTDSPRFANRQHGIASLGQELTFRAHETIMGRRTMKIARDLIASQSFDVVEIQTRQSGCLQKLLAHARRNCPFYRGSEYAAADSIETFDDLQLLPFISRISLRANASAMCRQDHTSKLLYDYTRGSTDEKLVYYWDRNRQAWDKANRIRGHAWHGFTHGHREQHLWPIDPPVDFSGRLRKIARHVRDILIAENQIDSLALDKIDPADFWSALSQFNPTRLTAFPSALAAMIQRDKLAAQKTRLTALKAVFLTGEGTFSWQRQLIEQVLRIPCFESYGVQEAGAIAYECPRRALHVCAESALVEYIYNDRPARPGELAEIVVTGLQSHAMPLIRYRTGDWVRVRDESCGCGVSLPVMPRLLGRSSDFLINDKGQLIEPARAIETLSSILGHGTFQIQQSPVGALEFSVLDNSCNREDIAPNLAMALQCLFGHRVAYTIRRVERLSRTEFGKCLYIHSGVVRPTNS